MHKELEQLKIDVTRWAGDGQAQALISNRLLQDAEKFNSETPASLFDQPERPLVVGFFGGTGVGKSSLLNRLAGEDVARTGVERPTSREVTLYMHSTVNVSKLPAKYPLEQIKTSFHNNDANRKILWIDMPDFDSIETANRTLVDDWLPHIDTLIYVVSPERYRDDNGWRLLQKHAGKHAWVFVINHWDRGTPAQREDFRSLLSDAGLQDPHLYCTDSSPEPEEDEFDQLQDFIQSMATSNTVAQLEERGILARLRELRALVQNGLDTLPSAENFKQADTDWNAYWERESRTLLHSLSWKYPLLTAHYAAAESGLFKSVIDRLKGKKPAQAVADELSRAAGGSFNPETQSVFEQEQCVTLGDDIIELAHIAGRNAIPARVVRRELENLIGADPSMNAGALADTLNRQVSQSLDSALADPGSKTRRYVSTLLFTLSSVLPLAALGWAGYRIVQAFYQGGSQPAQYLGSSFAVNAALLIALSWALPFFIARKLKPSLQQTAIRGLQQGAQQALQSIKADALQKLQRVEAAVTEFRQSGEQLFSRVNAASSPVPGQLRRILITDEEQH